MYVIEFMFVAAQGFLAMRSMRSMKSMNSIVAHHKIIFHQGKRRQEPSDVGTRVQLFDTAKHTGDSFAIGKNRAVHQVGNGPVFFAF